MTINKLNLPAKENAVQKKINEIIDNFPETVIVDQTFDGTSANAQSGVAINGELTSNYQTKLVSGTNIKTINNTSLLGSGNISLLQNTATGTNALTIGGSATQKDSSINIGVNSSAIGASCVSVGNSSTSGYGNTPNCVSIGASSYTNGKYSTAVGCNAQTSAAEGAIQLGYGMNTTANTLSIGFNGGNLNKNWQLLDGSTGLIPDARISTNIARSSDVANTTLSNVSSIDSNSAVQTALDGKVSKSGDTMTGSLNISADIIDSAHFINLVNENITKGTNPAQNTYTTISFNDRTNDSSFLNTRMGCVECSVNANGTVGMSLTATKNEVGSNIRASMQVLIDSSGNASCKFPNTTCVDGQYTETNETIVSSLNLNNSSSADTGWYTLSSLPDNSEYLCWIIGRGSTGSTSGNYVYCRVVSDIVTDYMTCCATRTRTASTVTSEGVICIPVRNKRVKFKRDNNWDGTGLFILRGYRRIGTNA